MEASRHIISLFISILLINLSEFSEGKPGIIRLCDTRGRQYTLTSTKCQAGLYLNSNSLGDDVPNGHMWNCICTSGSWFIYRKLCGDQENPGRFTTGDISCFNPRQYSESEVLGATYIGSSFDREMEDGPMIFTSTKNGLLIPFLDLESTWKMSRTKEKGFGGEIAAIRVNPTESWSLRESNRDTKLCLAAPEDPDSFGLYYYNITSVYSTQISEILNNLSGKQAPTATQNFQFLFEKGCNASENPVVYPEDLNTRVPGELIPGGRQDLTNECLRCLGPGLENPDDSMEDGAKESCVPSDLADIDIFHKEIDLQTSRMGLYWAKNYLDINGEDKQFDYVRDDIPEIQLLTKAGIIAFGACNMNYIPTEFYQYFLMMYKQLISESFRKYAPKAPLPARSYETIITAIGKCMERTKPYKFTKSKNCPTIYESFYLNGTRNTTPVPKEARANAEKHDYLMEFIWKLKSFLQFHCLEDFSGIELLYDALLESIESTFTDDILLRWANPSNSKKMYDHIFSTHLNLTATMQNFEMCVHAARVNSKLSVKLKRPIDDHIEELRYKNKKEPDNNGGKKPSEEEGAPLFDFPDPIEEEIDQTTPFNPDLLGYKFFDLFNGTAHCAQSVKTLINTINYDISRCW